MCYQILLLYFDIYNVVGNALRLSGGQVQNVVGFVFDRNFENSKESVVI